ncbi:MAG TPA: multidrug effflux MFS transporter [Victivallales bacterium]|nr:multidrug effflux MFS transporter [Victivallales bacterium]
MQLIQKDNKPLKTVFKLTPLAMCYVVAMDLIVPAIPELVHFFHSSQVQIQLIISLFALSGGIMQLFIGPLLDKFGRRKISLICAILYILSSLLCAFSISLIQLIISRFIQAFFATGLLVTSFAIIKDIYTDKDAAKSYNFLNAVMGVSPLLAPVLGSYLDIWFGWRSMFIFLSILGVITYFTIYYYINETIQKKSKEPLNLSVFRHYFHIWKNKQFIRYTAAVTSGLTYLLIFFSISPYILQSLLGLSKIEFSLWFAFMGIATFSGSIFGAKIVSKIGILNTVYLGIILSLLGSLLMFFWYIFFGLSIANFIIPMIFIGIGGILCMGSGTAGAMEIFPEFAGSASASICFFEFSISAVIGIIIMSWQVTSTLSFSIPSLIISSILLIIFSMEIIKTKNSKNLY